MQDVDELTAAYLARFGAMPPVPFGLPDEALAEAIQRALERGTPLDASDFPVPDSPDTAY